MDVILFLVDFFKEDGNAWAVILHDLAVHIFIGTREWQDIVTMCRVVLVPDSDELQWWLVKLAEKIAQMLFVGSVILKACDSVYRIMIPAVCGLQNGNTIFRFRVTQQ